MSNEDAADKSFEATPQKLEKAREKGEIARSTDLQTAAAYAGFTLALLVMGAFSLKAFGSSMMTLLDQTHVFAPLVFDGGAPAAVMGGLFWDTGVSTLPFFAGPALAVVLVIFAQRGFVFAPSKLEPKLSRISLIQNAKQKFGRNGWFEFAKSFIKLLVYSVFLGLFLNARLPEMVSAIMTEPRSVVVLLGQLCIAFLFVVVLVAAVIGGIDAVWQHQEHLRKNRMSRKEVTDETKDAEGDPYMKNERRNRARAIAAAQMMADVPGADVIVVNPTHYAVALKWDRQPGTAPICVAKGVNEIALRIREVAQEADVPIRSDPPTARALHGILEIGDEIHTEHYEAVAAAIRFADQMRERAKRTV
ncbi:MAG: flagellar type III secretion system protein FlhB [Pseudomonadota bacterium]